MNPHLPIVDVLPEADHSPVGTSTESFPVLDRLKTLSPGGQQKCELTVPTLEAGEQFRFHFDMSRCIGCRCCEVACNEQNNNPPEVNWRRVGGIEGGAYPNVTRLHLSTACNHCLEPSCLTGCPVDAYTKLTNGIVSHDAEACIGCQYCTWNCPYDVPQFHPERRVVTKCNMCVDRLAEGDLPACVNACPSRAIEIEAVDVEEWRQAATSGNAPGAPPSDLTLSTTRITLPEDLPEFMGQDEGEMFEPEDAHWSLVLFLVFSQLSVGLFGAALAFDLLGYTIAGIALGSLLSSASFVTGQLSLSAALFHLGRPIYAFRAMQAWRHSWLSREVIAFAMYSVSGAFAVGFSLVTIFASLGETASASVHSSLGLRISLVSTIALGVVGIYCSARIYLIPARPAWNSRRTTIQFFTTALLLGSIMALLLMTINRSSPSSTSTVFGWALAVVSGLSALVQAVVPWTLALEGVTTEELSLRRAAILMTRRFGRLLWLRTVLLCAVAILSPVAILTIGGHLAIALAALSLAAALVAELAGRYLFFVTVVPRNVLGALFTTKPVHH